MRDTEVVEKILNDGRLLAGDAPIKYGSRNDNRCACSPSATLYSRASRADVARHCKALVSLVAKAPTLAAAKAPCHDSHKGKHPGPVSSSSSACTRAARRRRRGGTGSTLSSKSLSIPSRTTSINYESHNTIHTLHQKLLACRESRRRSPRCSRAALPSRASHVVAHTHTRAPSPSRICPPWCDYSPSQPRTAKQSPLPLLLLLPLSRPRLHLSHADGCRRRQARARLD